MANEHVGETDQQRQLEAAYKNEILALIGERGISDAAVDYPAFLRLTTFGPEHLGDLGAYSLRMDGVQVVGIRSGPKFPAYHELFSEIEMEAMAEHQREAQLDLPTSVGTLVHWVFNQAGDVELAVPDIDEYPVDPAQWVDAVTNIAVQQSRADAQEASWRKRSGRKEKAREDAMARELEALSAGSADPTKVMKLLQGNAGRPGSCVVGATRDDVKWKADDGTERTMDMQALKKRLTRLNLK